MFDPYNVHYKAYQSLEPCTSVYLKQKWDKANYERYVERIFNSKYVVDDSPPFSYQHGTQLKNKENNNRNNKKQVIYLNQYDYNLKKAVEEQYKKDQLIKINENLLRKLKYMARKSDYGRDQLLKENKEHDRLLKSLSKYPPPHIQDTQNMKKKTTTTKKASTKNTTKPNKNIKVARKELISSTKKEVTKKKVSKSKENYDDSNNTIKQTKKVSKKANKSQKGNTKSTTKKNKKHKSKTGHSSSSSSNSSSNSSSSSSSNYSYGCGYDYSYDYNSSSSSSNSYSNSNSNSHSRSSSCDSSSSLISNDNQNHNENINNRDEIISMTSSNTSEYHLVKEKFDHLYDIPSKSSLPLFLGSTEGLDDEEYENIKTVKKKMLAETELIQNRQSLKEFDFIHLDI